MNKNMKLILNRNLKKLLTSNNLKRRFSCSSKHHNNAEISEIRNIGILAHIDAGKTTTTERMLYYSGKIRNMGEVHHGNTVTDYMDQERERGITIRSAAVTFNWKGHQFNLIDTPGHIDFTMEVEETLSVLDGAVVILDASAGVEAQTVTVWRQANRYTIPRIIFLNKMDRLDANINLCCKSVESKLEIPTLCLHLPVIQQEKFVGLIDVLTLEKIIPTKDGLVRTLLTEQTDAELWYKAVSARSTIIDKLSDFNDNFANIVIEADTINNIKTSDIQEALQKVTKEQLAAPILCGSAYKNIGVQPLMDSIVLYLPSPNDRSLYCKSFKNNLCARAFKVIHDKQKGPLVFLRMYAGTINKNQKIYNITRDRSEQSGRLYIAYADEYQEIDSLGNGNIAVVSGLKQTVIGDLLTSSGAVAQNAKKEMLKSIKKDNSLDESEKLVEKTFSTSTKIPEPVFFCSIELPSLAYQSSLEQALKELEREDPSVRIAYDEETGQTIVAGMGELHLEIIKDRILKEYKIKVDLGPLQIAYRESPITSCSKETTNEIKVGHSKHTVSVLLSIAPTDVERLIFKLDKTADAASALANVLPKHLTAVKQGIDTAILHGPKIHSQVINVQVMLHKLEIGRGTSDTMISATVTQCVQKILQETSTNILEPIMSLEIVIPAEFSSTVLTDLSQRRSIIINISVRGNTKIIKCETPLSELLGYSTALRTITSGTATFTMEFSEYKIMSEMDELRAIESIRGF